MKKPGMYVDILNNVFIVIGPKEVLILDQVNGLFYKTAIHKVFHNAGSKDELFWKF